MRTYPQLIKEYYLVTTSMFKIDDPHQLWTNGLPIYTGRHIEFYKCTHMLHCLRGMLTFSICLSIADIVCLWLVSLDNILLISKSVIFTSSLNLLIFLGFRPLRK